VYYNNNYRYTPVAEIQATVLFHTVHVMIYCSVYVRLFAALLPLDSLVHEVSDDAVTGVSSDVGDTMTPQSKYCPRVQRGANLPVQMMRSLRRHSLLLTWA
jgi:hypothetical protein